MKHGKRERNTEKEKETWKKRKKHGKRERNMEKERETRKNRKTRKKRWNHGKVIKQLLAATRDAAFSHDTRLQI